MNTFRPNFVKVLILGLIFSSYAHTVGAENLFFFNNNLYWGSSSKSADVMALQTFLRDQGLYTGPVTGNFLSLTYKAVKDFQAREGITPVSGYFGPITRRTANNIISSESKKVSLTSNQEKVLGLFSDVWSTPADVLPPPSPMPTPTPTPTPIPTPIPTPTPPTPTESRDLEWGAYVGNKVSGIAAFETLVGEEVDIVSVFNTFEDKFPMYYTTPVGAQGKTLLLFWESSYGFDPVIDGSKDALIRSFAEGAKTYGYPIMFAPYHEMNGNWTPWSGTLNNNTPAKFNTAWKRIHSIFKEVGATNVKFALVYNRISIPNVLGNQFDDYYPGDAYVDLVGVDGFNFGEPWTSFTEIYDTPLKKLMTYGKPIYIFSMGSVPGPAKAAWISDALGVQVHKYPVEGWVWFNQDGHDGNWLVNSDPASLEAFKNVIPD